MATCWIAAIVHQNARRTCVAKQPMGLYLVCLVVGTRRARTGDLTTPSTYDTIDFRGFKRGDSAPLTETAWEAASGPQNMKLKGHGPLSGTIANERGHRVPIDLLWGKTPVASCDAC